MDERTGVNRQDPRTPCDGCGRTTFNGEYVELWVASAAGRRVVWSGCVECWETRTEQEQQVTNRVDVQERRASSAKR